MRLRRRTRRRLVALAVILGLGIVGTWLWRFVRTAQARHLSAVARLEGMTAYRDGHYETARSRLGYYLTRHEHDVEALLALAESRSKLPEPEARHLVEAAGWYQAALQSDPHNRAALEGLLELYRQLGRRDAGWQIADRMLAIDAHHIEALATKGAQMTLEGRLDEALAYAQNLVDLNPDNLTWRASVLEIRRRQGASEEDLVDLCDSWARGYEGDGRFYLLKAQRLAASGHDDAARDAARTAAHRGADSSEILPAMIDLLDRLGLDEEASGVIASAVHRHPRGQWVVESSLHRLWQSQRVGEALAHLVDAERKLGASVPVLLRWKALLLICLGRTDEASVPLETLRAVSTTGDSENGVADRAWAESLLAGLRLDSSNWLETVGTYRRALLLQPKDPVLHYLLGDAYAEVGEHQLAAAWHERAMSLDPHWSAPCLALARSLLVLGRPRESLTAIVELLRRAPEAGFDAYILLAQAWLAANSTTGDIGLTDARTGRPVDIVELLGALVAQSGRDPAVAGLLVDAYLETGRDDLAVAFVADALAEDTPDPGLLLLLAGRSEQGDLGFEQRLIDRARAVAGLTLEVADAQARLWQREGRAEEGLALIDQAWTASPDRDRRAPHARLLRVAYMASAAHPEACNAMAGLLEDEGDRAAAAFILSAPAAWQDPQLIATAIDRLRMIVGDTPSVLLSRASHLLRFEPADPAALAKAMVLVGDVLEQTPDSAAAHLLLSRLLVAGPNPDFDRAAEHLQRALRFSAARAKRDFSLFASWHSDGEAADRYLRLIPRLGVAAAFEALALLEPLLCGSPAGRLAVAEQWVKLGSRGDDHRHYERAAALMRGLSVNSDEEWAIASGQLRGWIAFGRGDLSLSESYLRGVLSKEPRNLVALNNLAFVLLQQGDRIQEAVAISRRAVDLAPDVPEYLDTHLQALMGAGRLGEAERAVRRALTRRSDCPRLRLMLVKVLLARSRFEDAQGELMEAASNQKARPPPDECRGDVEALWEELLQARATMSPGLGGGGHVAPR